MKTAKLSKNQRQWANKNAEKLADSIGIWHSAGCPAFHGGGMVKCDCGLAETICTLQEESNYDAGILPRQPRVYA